MIYLTKTNFSQNLLTTWASNVMLSLTYYPIANEDWMRSFLRYQLAPFMCNSDVAACRTAATTQFEALRDQNTE